MAELSIIFSGNGPRMHDVFCGCVQTADLHAIVHRKFNIVLVETNYPSEVWDHLVEYQWADPTKDDHVIRP